METLDEVLDGLELAARVRARTTPESLLPIPLAAVLMGKREATLRVDVTRRPELLPKFLRVGRRVYFRRSTVDAWLNASAA